MTMCTSLLIACLPSEHTHFQASSLKDQITITAWNLEWLTNTCLQWIQFCDWTILYFVCSLLHCTVLWHSEAAQCVCAPSWGRGTFSWLFITTCKITTNKYVIYSDYGWVDGCTLYSPPNSFIHEQTFSWLWLHGNESHQLWDHTCLFTQAKLIISTLPLSLH